MNELTQVNTSLPSLVSRAAEVLASATSSAEVLEARDLASAAYSAAKSAGRMKAVKDAHDDLLVKVYRAQADALIIESQAKSRLADEYDAAQERGEVAGHGRSKVEGSNVTTASDLGLRRDEIHEARQVRDAVKAKPDILEKTTDELIEQGLEPTKARIREAVLDAISKSPQKVKKKDRDPDHDDFLEFLDCCEKIVEADVDFIASYKKLKHSYAEVKEILPRAISTLQSLKELMND